MDMADGPAVEGRARRAAVASLGCKVNRYDAQTVISALEEAGYEIVDFSGEADVYIINTCAVTGEAAKKSKNVIRRAASLKNSLNPEAVLVAAGCWSEVEKEEALSIPGVSVALGTKDYGGIVSVIEERLSGCLEKSTSARTPKQNKKEMTRAYLKIEDGCDNFCSYCIIPYARGAVKSRPFRDILSEANTLAQKGFKEIVLTGIHVASYGKDLDTKKGLVDLCEEINGIKGVKRLRLSSLSPSVVTEEFAKRLKRLGAFCDYFHLSLQSGSRSVLSRMERGYEPFEYLNAVSVLKREFPDCAVWSDIIAGFPGETSAEFEEGMAFIERSGIVNLHVFPFSAKKGTKAYEMGEMVPAAVKSARARELKQLGDRLYEKYLAERLGSIYEVLFEAKKDGLYRGHTSNYILVKAYSDKNIVNKIIKVRLKSIEKNGGVYEVMGAPML